MIPITGHGLLTMEADFKADGRSRADIVLAAGYVRKDGKPNYTGFYEALLKAKGIDINNPPKPGPPGGIERICGDGPAIYVACLASYNAGKLFGFWLDLSDGPDADDIREAIDAVIKDSPEPFAEEYAIHDSQSLPGFLTHDEWPDIDQLATYCQQWAELPDSGDAIAYQICCTMQARVLDADEFHESFLGWWSSPTNYAMDWALESGYLKDEDVNPLLRHVDWVSVWRDLEADGYSASFIDSQGGYLILRNE